VKIIDKHYKEQHYQTSFMDCEARFPALVAAWATGKSMWGLFKGLDLSKRYPNNLGMVIRKEGVRLDESTIPDFEQYTDIKVPSNRNVTLDNGSTIMFRHGDELLGILQNVNLGWFILEQAEEFKTSKEFDLLRGRLRRGNVGFRQGIILANTEGHNWIWRRWKKVDPERDAVYALFEATTFDNAANLPDDYIEDCERMAHDAPHNYNRVIMNSWEDVDLADKVVPYSLVRDAFGFTYRPLRQKTLVSLEPAEFGNDETVIYGIRNTRIIKRDIYCKKEPMETGGRAYAMLRELKALAVVIDPIGVGSGIRSRLLELGCPVISADARLKSSQPETYFNMRAEMWFAARKRFADRTVSITDEDAQLIEDLTGVGYTMTSSGLRKIDPKEQIRKADYLGRSPGRGECLVQALWAEQLVGYDEDSLEDTDYGRRTETGMPASTGLAESYAVKSVW